MKIKCLVLLICAVSFFGCGESKQTKVEEEVPAVDSSEVIQQDTTASVSELAEAQMDENTIMEIWDAYIKSDYCDIAGDTKKARTQVVREGTNVASLKLDEANEPLDIPEGEEFLPPTVTETFACYPLSAGGCLVLWYYDGSEWGRKIFAVFSYKDKELTRLKNSFPPFADFVDSNYSSDWDSLAKLSGTEVVYFKQDCWPTKFDSEGFGMSEGGMEETWYKFDGKGFVKK